MQSVGQKKNKKNTVNCCNATITKSAQYKVEPITKYIYIYNSIWLDFMAYQPLYVV